MALRNRPSPFPIRRPPLRWIDYARRSWQRLGHLRVLCFLAHPATGTSLEGLTDRFKNEITRLHRVPDTLGEQVSTYLRAHRKNRYTGKDPVSHVELQDLYLSNPQLRSQTGAITGDMDTAGYRHAVYVEIPTWAVRLRLLRRDNYTLTDRGKVLNSLSRNRPSDLRTFHHDNNPYMLTPGERYFFSYCLLEADGDLIQGILSTLVERGGDFTRGEVGQIIADILRHFSTHRLSRAASGHERNIKDRIAATIRSIDNQRETGMGPRESVATPRTEPLVDCGMLDRTSPAHYKYRVSTDNLPLVEALTQAPSLGGWLEKGLAQWFFQPSRSDTLSLFRPLHVRNYVARSYRLLRSGLGYCSIREVALLAVALAIDDADCSFELLDAEEAISETGREYGNDVRFTKSRQGDIAQVRIASRVIEELASLGQ